MKLNPAQLLIVEISLGVNKVILPHQEVRGIHPEKIEIGSRGYSKDRTEVLFWFELQRFTQEGFGYTYLEGQLTILRAKKNQEWRTGTVTGSVKELGQDKREIIGGHFLIRGGFNPGSGFVVELCHKKESQLIATFTI